MNSSYNDIKTNVSASKEQQNNENNFSVQIPSINLPKGGGALKGIDEKFSVNPANGTAAFSIPLPLTPARNGFQPALALSYNSGTGNSVYGLGWNIDYPAIQRKTEKRLPRYFDDEESDVFMFSGLEDLVPKLKQESNEWKIDEEIISGFKVKRYRPRIEGAFSRIEQISLIGEKIFYWKVTTRDNIVTFFGRSNAQQIIDPNNSNKIFKWLPELSFDDKGNCVIYEYKQENKDNVVNTVSENNRVKGLSKFTNRYLKRIKYGNILPFYPDYSLAENIYNPVPPDNTEFLFEVVFDYGEHVNNDITGTEKWNNRIDPFSDYRAGFELRTYRLCQRIMMFHHFTNEEFGWANNDTRIPYLVRSLDFSYESSSLHSPQQSEVTYLQSIAQTGYKKNNSGYHSKSLPPVEFTYQELNWNREIKTISPENIVHAPAGLSNNYQWVDLYNEGIAGILTEQGDAWYYKSNLGDGSFSIAKPVSPKPSFNGLATGILQFQDLDADGTKQIVVNMPGVKGYFELTDDEDWNVFQSFQQMPGINLQDANTRLIDLNGDGMADIVVTEENVFSWYPSKGKKGYDSKELSMKPYDEERGPAIVFADSTQSIFLADMSGDGLTDIVRIRNGEICYWPNLGYGNFGAKVNMGNAPLFDSPDNFNPAYLHLVDVSGTGVTDILYLGKNSFKAWLNLSGNKWSTEFAINPFFTTEQPNQLAVVDLLGNGTSCIVWSSPLPSNANAPMRYIDLMGGKKPHIMHSYKNNFGKETTFEYKSSSYYYLEDKKNGKPWITKLPFPVQCVSKVVVTDSVTDLRFTNQYEYHHGYFDHAEREFRGFGMVEQIDTEEFELLNASGASNGTEQQFYEPPVLTKTWFHLGAYFRNKKILDHFIHEYWYNNESLLQQYGNLSDKEFLLPDALFIGDLTTQELIEAHRACKGMMLRQEVFSLDGSEKELLPYSVVTHNCHIKKLQPVNENRFAVFMVQESEGVTFSFERNIDDPRIAHSLNIEIDDLGNVLKSAAVVYPRKNRPAELTEDKIWDEQNKQHIIFNENSFTQDIISPAVYRLRLPYETKSFELKGAELPDGKFFYSISDLNITAEEIGYEEEFTSGIAQKRLIEKVKTIYRNNDLVTPMPEGQHDSLGLSFESYQFAFTPSLIESIYKSGGAAKVDSSMLEEGKYVDLNNDGNWWIRSGTVQYINESETTIDAAQRFYSPQSYTDPFGSVTSVKYYGNYFLQVEQTKDELDNTITTEAFDFRTLSPLRVKDMNGNITEVAIDIFGLVTGSAIMGKENEADNLDEFEVDLTNDQINAFINSPELYAKDLLKNATSRMVYDFSRTPCVVGTIVREEHYTQNQNSKLQYSFEYSDGLGNVLLKKIQAEPGEAPHRDENGDLVRFADGGLDLEYTERRWIGNGRTILNNKGKPVKQYEPYFSDSHLYEEEPELRETGVTPVLHYDAAGRLIKTEMPDDTFSKVEYDAWKQSNYDASDTVLEGGWYTKRMNPSSEDLEEFIREGKDPLKEKAAAEKTAVYANTPTTIHLDSLGRPFFSIAHNKRKDFSDDTIIEEFYSTYSILDIEGNLKAVIDACGNTVMQYKYDMLGHQVYQNSMDAGEKWLLNDCMSKPKYVWNIDAQNNNRDDNKILLFETRYDVLHRPLTVTLVKENVSTVVERMEYRDAKGLDETELNAQQQLNLIGKSVVQYDEAGITRLVKCDFKGNALETSRQYCKVYKDIPDWKEVSNVEMEEEAFVSSTEFDALNRPVKMYTPHTNEIPASVIVPEYNEANLLNAVTTNIRGSNNTTSFITNIDYDAKGQRQAIYYGNNTKTRYDYDEKTFRLIRLLTTGNSGTKIFQDLHYTYEALGNITHIYDNAFEPMFFNNRRIDAIAEYDYDATYQLIRATGRELAGQSNINETATNNNFRNFPFEHRGVNVNDVQAVRNYTQQYVYDSVGNILKMQHVTDGGNWTRTYRYNNNDADRTNLNIDTSAVKNNQLLATTISNNTTRYAHDIHGNMLNLPHLQSMMWNFKDQLAQVDLGGGGTAFYVYDSTGQRIRKVIERNEGTKEERLYLGVIEIYRETSSAGERTKQTDTLHIVDNTKRIAMVDTPVIKTDLDEEQVVRFIYSNHLGSFTLELSDEEEPGMISYEEYHPYGTTAYSLQNSEIKVAAKRYRYTGMERDEETGLNYHHARYYANWLGRWIASDPIGIKGGNNLYSYVLNNPINKTDLMGKAPRPNAMNEGTYWHAVSLPLIAEKINQYKKEGYSAHVEVKTHFGGSKKGVGRGEIDLVLEVVEEGHKVGHIYDLKTLSETLRSSTIRQIQGYIPFGMTLIRPDLPLQYKQGTALEKIFQAHPDVLDPIITFDKRGRLVFLSFELGKDKSGKVIPGVITYHVTPLHRIQSVKGYVPVSNPVPGTNPIPELFRGWSGLLPSLPKPSPVLPKHSPDAINPQNPILPLPGPLPVPLEPSQNWRPRNPMTIPIPTPRLQVPLIFYLPDSVLPGYVDPRSAA